jgi:hypothetical protein
MAIRYSHIDKALRKNGDVALADRIALAKAKAACPEHGDLGDPVIGMQEDGRILFFCPRCCGSAVRELWEAEGPTEPTNDEKPPTGP